MEIKLVINGEDKRIRLTPNNECDKKILEIVNECDSAKLTTHKKNNGYGYSSETEIEYIDLQLEILPAEV